MTTSEIILGFEKLINFFEVSLLLTLQHAFADKVIHVCN